MHLLKYVKEMGKIKVSHMPTKRKSTTKKSTRKTTRSRKSRKPKVYIPAYKIIMLCAVIIAVCMGLLLVTTVKSNEASTIAQRYEEEVKGKEDNKKADSKKESVTKKDTKKTENKVEGKKKEESPKKQETKPVETKKPETAKSDKKPAKPQAPVQNQSEEKKTEKQETKPATPAPAAPATSTAAPAAAAPVATTKYDFPAAVKGAQIIFVFDDGGQNLSQLKPYLELPMPVTIAVLPRLAHSVEAARQIRATPGKELMLHQPMQSVNANVNPGPGAITPDMSEDQIISTLFTNINEIGPIAGFNNHEGSGITADAEKMAVIMKVASENGVYFLDSRTNVETKVPYVARELGYTYYERNIFLDNEKTRANALAELKKGLAIANKNGNAIMIGHVWSADFLPAFIQDVYPELKEKGYTFSTVSKSKALKR